MEYILELYENGETWFFCSVHMKNEERVTTTSRNPEKAAKFPTMTDAERVAKDLMKTRHRVGLGPVYEGYRIVPAQGEPRAESH